MPHKSVTIDRKAKTLTVVMQLEEPYPSKSGKTMTLATTNGFVKTDAKYDEQEVQVNINAFIRPKA